MARESVNIQNRDDLRKRNTEMQAESSKLCVLAEADAVAVWDTVTFKNLEKKQRSRLLS